MPWGDTDSGGQLRPKVSFTGGAVGIPDLTFPVTGFTRMDEDWVPEKIVNAAANASRTVSESIVGYRGVFTVHYAYLTAEGRRFISRVINIGGRVYFYPHSDTAENYLCRVSATTGIMQQLDGRAIGYGPLSITFETVTIRASVPCESERSHFSDKDLAYVPADEFCCFSDKDLDYDPDDKIGWFNKAE
ncbi:MAG: hypothetical protein NTW26_07005 [bacterium]|nr:hypothetical protein [bacterium]